MVYGKAVYDDLKYNIFKAQRMYFLSIKLDGRILPCMRRFSVSVLNKYIMAAKSVDLKLTDRELIDKLIE